MIDKEAINKELEELLRAFNIDIELNYSIEINGNIVNITINYGKIYNTSYQLPVNCDNTLRKRLIKRYIKRDYYRVISSEHNIKLPYGSLTGIRPTKLYYELQGEVSDPAGELVRQYDISFKKAHLVERVVSAQKDIYKPFDRSYDLFINIPFCPSRCSYCSFLSMPIGKASGVIEKYYELLLLDIERALSIAGNRHVRAIYIGGGTPTALNNNMLKGILNTIRVKADEFTVEAGRPDSINLNNLKLLKDYGVSRISVNPETFNLKTLLSIGRNHSVEDIYKAYYKARDIGFDINMDLIAMLPGEDNNDFSNSVDETIRLKPDNITIHTLSLKRGSKLTLSGHNNINSTLATNMIDYADNVLSDSGYIPYYLYRQKYMSGSLENTGYSLPGKQCIYNVDIMEETHSIIACGAGAISKRVEEDRIERAAFAKDIMSYIERFDEMLIRRDKLFG